MDAQPRTACGPEHSEAGGYELYHRADVPDNVAVSEAMEMANRYSEPKSGRYINGVLGAMVRDKQESKA